MPSPQPKIDEQYWFNYSEGLVTKNQERAEQAADKLQNLVLWLWGIYTTLAAVGFTLSKKNLPDWAAWVIALTSVMLIVVYWCTAWVRIPKLVQFDPRSPSEIKDAYVKASEARAFRLAVTTAAALIAAVMVGASLVAASLAKEHSDPKSPSLDAVLYSEPNRSDVSIKAHVGTAAEATIDVRAADGSNLNVPRAHLLPADGLIQTSIPLPGGTAAVQVNVEWTDGGVTWRLRRDAVGKNVGKK